MQDTFLPNHSKNKYFGNLKVYEMLDDVLEKIESHVNTVDPVRMPCLVILYKKADRSCVDNDED